MIRRNIIYVRVCTYVLYNNRITLELIGVEALTMMKADEDV